MDNFLIIDDVDTCYIEQNSWLIVLQKQIMRNYYLFRLYEHDKWGKKIKISPKELHHKMKSSINSRIKNKIKDRKNQQKNSYLSQSSNASLNLRRNSQEMQKKNLLKLLAKHDKDMQKPCRYFIPPKLQQSPTNKQNCKQSVKKFNFLPFPGTSLEIQLSVNFTKKQSKKLIQRQQKKMSKVLSHTKPILSLHDLQLQTKDLFPSQQTYFHKQLTKMEKHLLRTQMNSTKKDLGSTNNGKNCFVVKKIVEEFPDIGRLDCKSMICSYPQINKQTKTPHIQTQPIQHYSLSPQTSQKTPQTKQSSQCDPIAGLESYLQNYINSKKPSTEKDEVFEDNHISISKTTVVRNYRISKVRNINFPVC